jgi:hypothetical protein
MGNGNNSSKFNVSALATSPDRTGDWSVDLSDLDIADQLIYTNLAFDLLAITMGKLGIAMSEHVLGNDSKLDALAEETAVGRVNS